MKPIAISLCYLGLVLHHRSFGELLLELAVFIAVIVLIVKVKP